MHVAAVYPTCMTCRDPGADRYDEQYRSRVLANLTRRAKSLGFVLQAVPRARRWLFLRKGAAYFAEGVDMKFGFVAKHRGVWPVGWLCEALGVSRSGFHAWLKREPSTRTRTDEALLPAIRSSFAMSARTYGVRRGLVGCLGSRRLVWLVQDRTTDARERSKARSHQILVAARDGRPARCPTPRSPFCLRTETVGAGSAEFCLRSAHSIRLAS